MSIADSLLKKLQLANGLTREFVYGEIARDYGEGFARVMREKFEESERKKGANNDRR